MITAVDMPTSLKQKYMHTILGIFCTDEDFVRKSLDAERIAYYPFGDRLRAEAGNAVQVIELLDRLKNNITDFEFRHGTLNDVFLGITEKGGN